MVGPKTAGENQVLKMIEIINRYKGGDSIKQLAISFGLKMDFIRDLLRGRRIKTSG